MAKNSRRLLNLANAREQVLDLDSRQSIIANRSCYAQGTREAYDLHFPCEMGIVLSGHFRRIDREAEVLLERGMLWWHGSWEPHGWAAEKRSTALVFVFLPSVLYGFSHLELPPYLPFIRPDIRHRLQPRDPRGKRDMIARAQTLFAQINAGQPGWKDAASLDLARMTVQSMRGLDLPSLGQSPVRNKAAHIFKAVEYIHANLGQKLTLAGVARVHHMGRTRFSQGFSRLMGISFGQYLIGSRLERARLDILQGQDKLHTIALRWGFADASHLSRFYRGRFGASPRGDGVKA